MSDNDKDIEIIDGTPENGTMLLIVTTMSGTKKTSEYMTKYEKARILGTRALQIGSGSPIMVDYGEEKDSLRIALMELRQGKIPMIIRRKLPDGSHEDWAVADMIIR